MQGEHHPWYHGHCNGCDVEDWVIRMASELRLCLECFSNTGARPHAETRHKVSATEYGRKG